MGRKRSAAIQIAEANTNTSLVAKKAKQSGQIADIMANVIKGHGHVLPGFYFFRTDWVNPGTVTEAMAILRRQHPELNCEATAPREFFALFKKSLEGQGKIAR